MPDTQTTAPAPARATVQPLHPGFVPPPIADASKPLVEGVAPSGWENLGGGLRWYELSAPVAHETYGTVFPIKYTGPIGAIVKALVQSQRAKGKPSPPNKSYLLHGAAGIGKTLALQLMAETFLATEHEPVGLSREGKLIPFVDETGQVLLINPSLPVRPSQVERALARETLDNPKVQVYNAGKGSFDKKAVDEMVENVKRAYPFGRRVFMVGEIDGIRYDQSAGIRTGLDPHHGVPDNVLVLADTNHLETVKRNLQAGFQRFTQITIREWTQTELAELAAYYCRQLGVTFALEEFRDDNEPYFRMGTQAQGAVRELLLTLDYLKNHDGQVTLADLEGYLNRGRVTYSEPPRAVMQFFDLPNYNPATVAAFCLRQAERNTGFFSFTNGMAQYLAEYYPEVVGDLHVQRAVSSLGPALGLPQDGLSQLVWVMSSGPLAFIGGKTRETFFARQQQQQQQQTQQPLASTGSGY